MTVTSSAPAPPATSTTLLRCVGAVVDAALVAAVGGLALRLLGSRCAAPGSGFGVGGFADGCPPPGLVGTLYLGSSVWYVAGAALWLVVGAVGLALVGLALLTAAIGATPGKLLLGLRVRSVDGGRPSRRQALARLGIGLLVDGFPYLFPVAGVLALRASGGRRRHGDHLAGTEVVRREPRALRPDAISRGRRAW